MTEKDAESEVATWKAPQCPFEIEYSVRVLDDIRLAVVDAFFSLPRGGAEIGGILLGRHLKGRIEIEDYVALDCEHASGPSFALSVRDQDRLVELLAAEKNPDRLKPVGWYHSHTRSEVFLSEADQDLHNRYFPEPWQVALVLKPHTFHPTRAGFFFREPDGSMHGTASYREFALAPLPVRPLPSGDVPATESAPSTRLGRGPDAGRPEIAVEAEAAPQGPARAEEPVSKMQPEGPPLPNFLAEPAKRERHWLAAVLVLAIVGAAAGYETRSLWLPRLTAAILTAPELSVELNATDNEGQLQIQWDGNSPTVRQGTTGILQIDDGLVPWEVQLNARHLRAGAFVYSRQSERVDIKLAIRLPGGQQAHGATSYLGRLPEHKPPPEDPEIRKQRDALAAEAAKLKSDLAAEVVRTRKLAQSLDEVKKAFQEQQRKRLENQSPER
jgi:proteasome lid subunit RPN8/RPN11